MPMGNHNKDTETDKTTENQILWRDPDLLECLYWEKGLTQSEIADRLGCCVATVSKWMRRLEVPRRGPKIGPSKGRTADGYIQFSDGERTVMAHQLSACLHTDPYQVFDEQTVVHHGNHHPFDNTPSNLEVMDRSDHTRLHHHGVWVRENGFPRLRIPLADGGDE